MKTIRFIQYVSSTILLAHVLFSAQAQGSADMILARAESSDYTTSPVTIAAEKSGSVFLLQQDTPSAYETRLLRNFLLLHAEGRQLLYHILYGSSKPVYLFIGASGDDQPLKRFTADGSVIENYIRRNNVKQLIFNLSDGRRRQNIKSLAETTQYPRDKAMIVLLDSDMLSAELPSDLERLDNDYIRVIPIAWSLFTIDIDKDALRGGPRYKH